MRKFFLVFLCLSLLIVATLTVFGAKNNLILATGGTAGTYYPYGGAIAQIFNTKVKDMNVTAQSTGASAENIRLVSKGEAELAIVQNDVMDYAYNGTETFTGNKIGGFTTIATLYPEVIQIVVSPESKIKSVADMKGKRISVGAAGSGVEANAKQILEAYGLTFKDIKVSRLSFNESASAYKDKQIDGFFVTAGIPNTAIQEICMTQNVKILPLTKTAIKKIMDKYKFYTEVTINKSMYKGMTSDVNTVAVNATLVAKKDLDTNVVYELTKALFENKEELGNVHAKGKELDINNAVKGVSVPFHPGAEKYYIEKGVLKKKN